VARLPGPSLVGQLRYVRALAAHAYLVLPELYRRYGPVCEVGRPGPFRYVLLFGAEANELLLSGNPGNFLWRDATAPLIPVDGDTALVVSDGDDHRRRRRLVQPAFARKRIEGYLPITVDEVTATVDRWRPGDVVDVHGELRASVRRIVIRALFGDRLQARADELGDHLQVALDYVNRPPVLRFDHDLPGTAYRRAMAARRRADEIVFAEIAERRARPDGGGDVLTALLDAQNGEHGEHGEGFTDQEVRDQVISLIAAGYDTASAGVAWAVHALYSRPDVLDAARAEVAEVAGDDPLTADHLAGMPYLGAVVSESLRLWPPGPISGRRAIDDFELAGHRVPGGSLVLYSPYLTHRLPELWPEPERFLPERWIPGSPAHREPVPYSYLPFGGGYRRCIGFALATMETAAMLAELVRRVDLRPHARQLEPTGLVTMAPRGGVVCTVASPGPAP
jgi:cytochrome P450